MTVSSTILTGLTSSFKVMYGLTTKANGNLDFFNTEFEEGIAFNVDLKYSDGALASVTPPLVCKCGGITKGGGGNDKSAIGAGSSLNKSV
ncbi:hypothetical protein WICMUC_004846 [Wickerhamomyces mucosus]|uniref:Uncharacterized protein n=1 Tax=Wickerhamomyces mucosus TaxID=1378264 RepID=A0A9P8PET7_9ASCO|nr:hypothetical protein WICMUC_004846 [Wickerhamomyces mucosus]